MKPTTLRLAVLLALTSVGAFAVPVTLTWQEATNLHGALSSVQAGLSPLDTVAAADDINLLRQTATDLQDGQQAAMRLQAQVPAGPEQIAKQLVIGSPIEELSKHKLTLDLIPIDIGPDEIKDAHITAATLSVIRRFLAPPKPKP